ncbi:Protein WALLS ARE THIN 1 [Hibiscus syriacus]|uniref:WAT1-related protein n=1 Tax=Hibiscus syriacus TaxID=106335 RepID=A0A6A2XCJ6_HIBSY|nr:Protein WALLS ARE THIN 1 [Hibiscus syriacus]
MEPCWMWTACMSKGAFRIGVLCAISIPVAKIMAKRLKRTQNGPNEEHITINSRLCADLPTHGISAPSRCNLTAHHHLSRIPLHQTTHALPLNGFHIVSRVALNIGVSKVVYPVYRNIIALLLLSPLLISWKIFNVPQEGKTTPYFSFAGSVLPPGITGGFYLLGLYYASPTFASAMQNSVPAITFVAAAALRLEQIDIARRHGQAKVLGTINWTWGCIYLVGHCLSWAGWLVFQAPVLKKYPAKLTLTSFTCFFGLIQFLVIAAFVETDFNNLKIQSMEELFTILYAGVVASGIVFSLQTWCIHKGGPVFVAVFQPLQTLLVAFMAFVILGDKLYSGRSDYGRPLSGTMGLIYRSMRFDTDERPKGQRQIA